MKLEKLLQARKTISAHSQEAISVPLAYKMMKFLKASDNEDVFYISKLKEIIEKYKDTHSDTQASDGDIRIQKEKVQECNKELAELSATEVEAPSIRFKLSELNELKLSVAEIYSFDDFIDEEE